VVRCCHAQDFSWRTARLLGCSRYTVTRRVDSITTSWLSGLSMVRPPECPWTRRCDDPVRSGRGIIASTLDDREMTWDAGGESRRFVVHSSGHSQAERAVQPSLSVTTGPTGSKRSSWRQPDENRLELWTYLLAAQRTPCTVFAFLRSDTVGDVYLVGRIPAARHHRRRDRPAVGRRSHLRRRVVRTPMLEIGFGLRHPSACGMARLAWRVTGEPQGIRPLRRCHPRRSRVSAANFTRGGCGWSCGRPRGRD
jgi:hypothetical protein